MSGIVKQQMLVANSGGQSQAIAISTTSAQSSALTSNSVNICATVDCFMRMGSNPTALSDGTDQFIPQGVLLQVSVVPGQKLAFKAASSGTAYLTQE